MKTEQENVIAPRRTPEWVGVSTGDDAVDKAFAISVELVEDLTRQYHEQKGQKGWLPVSGGARGPVIVPSDTRDSAHAVKMAAYLWGAETDLSETLTGVFFIGASYASPPLPRHPPGVFSFESIWPCTPENRTLESHRLIWNHPTVGSTASSFGIQANSPKDRKRFAI